MKIYRIVPDTFSTAVGRSVLGEYNYLGFEDLYYKMGYTSLQTNETISSFIDNRAINSFDDQERKFFFIYPEENFKYAIFLSKYITLNYILLEYDFPIDILVDSVGYGKYDTKFLPEFGIDFKKISTEVSSVSKEEKRKIFIESLQYTKSKLKEIDKYGDFDLEAEDLYEEYIEIEDQVFESKMYQDYLNKNGSIYKNPYLTGNYAFISFDELVSVNKKQRPIEDLLSEKNIIISDSRISVNNDLEQELISSYNNDSKEEIRKILTKF